MTDFNISEFTNVETFCKQFKDFYDSIDTGEEVDRTPFDNIYGSFEKVVAATEDRLIGEIMALKSKVTEFYEPSVTF